MGYLVTIYQDEKQIDEKIITTNVAMNSAIQEALAKWTNLTTDGTLKIVIQEKNIPEGYKNSNKVDVLYFTCEYKNADDYLITNDLVPYIIYDADNSTLPASDVEISNANRTVRINYKKEPVVFLNIKTSPKDPTVQNVLPRKTYRVTSYEEGNSSVQLSNLNPANDEAEINDIIQNYMVKSNLEVEKRTGLSGELTFEVGKPVPNKTVVYVIEELNDDGYYVETTKVGIEFNSKGKISDYYILAVNNLVDFDKTDNYIGESHFNLEILIDTEDVGGSTGVSGSGGNGASGSNVGKSGSSVYTNNAKDEFDLILTKCFEYNSKVKISDVEFSFEVYDKDGNKLDEYTKVTDDKGVINLQDIALKEQKTFKIKEIKTKDGFILDANEYEFTVDNRSDGSLRVVSNSDSLRDCITPDGLNRIINIELKTSLNGNSFVLENVDSSDVSMLISDGVFEIKDDTKYAGGQYDETVDSLGGTGIERFTITNGVGLVVFPEKTEGTYTFTINQISAPTGYKLQDESVKFDVEYDSNMNIIDVLVTKGYTIAVASDKRDDYIKLTYLNEQNEIAIGPYSLSIIKVDENDKDIVLPGAEFEVTINNEIGVAQLIKTGVTNVDGDLSIDGINGAGTIKIDLKELVAPENYQVNTKELSIEITRDVDTGKMLLINQSNLDTILESSRNKITVYVADKLDEDLFNLTLNKIDEAGKPVISNFTRFRIGEENGISKVYATNASGKIVINNLRYPNEDGVVNYTIKEVQAPVGYKKIEDEMKIAITFETNSNTGVREITDIAVVEGNLITAGTYKNDYVEFDITNKIGSLFIEKQDSKDELLKVIGTTFEITNESTNDVVTTVTNEDGLADVDLDVGTYTIVESQPTAGFVANTDTIRLEVSVDTNNKKQYNILSGNAELVNEGKTSRICIKNAQEVMTLAPYSIEVIKVDPDDDEIRLKDAQMRLNISNENGAANVTKTDVTDDNGIVSINELYGSGEINIALSELKAPKNRKIDSKERKIKLYRDETTGVIECDSDAGLEVEVENNKVKIYYSNEYIKDFYSLVLQKVDDKGNNIKSEDFVFEFSNEDMTDVKAVSTNANGKIIIKDLVMPSVEKDEVYYLQEIYGIEGYDVITDRLKIVLQFRELNGVMKLISAYSDNKDYIQAKKLTGTYTLLNVINSQEQRSKVVLEKVDSTDNLLKVPGIEFEIKNLSTNETKTVTTDKDGRISIPIETADVDVPLSITEITSDAGFDKLNEFKVNVKYDSLQEKSIASKLTLSPEVKIDATNNVSKIVVSNTQQPINNIGAYKIEVIKHDKDEIDLVKQRALFHIDIENEYGVKKENKTDYTDTDGKVTINEMNGYGDIAITIQERKQPVDYEFDDTIRKVNLYRDEYTGKFEFESGEEISEDDVVIDNQEKIIKIYIPNKLLNEKFNFVIESLGQNNEILKNRGSSFEITEVETGNKQEYFVQDSGKVIIHKIQMPENAGSLNYKIKQKTAPIGYILRDDKEINVEVKFKRLSGVMVVSDIIIEDTSYIKYNKVSKQLVNIGFLNMQRDDLYLGSSVYVVDDNNIRNVKPNTKVYDFMGNLFTNGTLTIYDWEGNEVDLSNAEIIIEEGYRVKAEKGVSSIERTVMLKKENTGDVALDSTVYTIDDVYIDRVAPNTSVKDFVKNLDYDGNITVTDKKGNQLDTEDTNTLIGSEAIVRIEKDGDVIEKTVIVVGDYNGDGTSNVLDVGSVNRYSLGLIPNSELRTRICDITGDGQVNVLDVGRLNRYSLGLIPKLI